MCKYKRLQAGQLPPENLSFLQNLLNFIITKYLKQVDENLSICADKCGISGIFKWDSLHARLNSHYKVWSYKKKKHKKITAYRISVQKKPTVKRCLLILYLKPLRSQVKGKYSIGREFQSLAVQGKKLLTQTSFNIQEW